MSTSLKDEDLDIRLYGFQDKNRYSYPESYRMTSPFGGFYAVRRDLGGRWHAWHFATENDMETFQAPRRRYFGFTDTFDLTYARVIEDLVIEKMHKDE